MRKEPTEQKQPYVVFKRSDSNTWAMRFTLPGHPQIRIGLGTDDEQAAHSLAAHKYLEAKVKADNGLLTGTMSFNKIALGYLDAIRKEAERNPKRLSHVKNAEAVVTRFLIPYFGKKAITAILHRDLVSYTEWRRRYWTEGPGKSEQTLLYERAGKMIRMPVRQIEAGASTLKRESTVIAGVFKHAVQKGYLRSSDVPKQDLGRTPKNKRPAFTKEQYDQLLLCSEQRILAASSQPKLLFERYMLGRVDKRDSQGVLNVIQAGICDGDQLGTRPDVGRGMGVP